MRLGARGFQTRGLRSSSTPHGVLDAAVFLQLRYTTGLRSVSSQGHSRKSLVSRVFMEFDDAHLCDWPPRLQLPQEVKLCSEVRSDLTCHRAPKTNPRVDSPAAMPPGTRALWSAWAFLGPGATHVAKARGRTSARMKPPLHCTAASSGHVRGGPLSAGQGVGQ